MFGLQPFNDKFVYGRTDGRTDWNTKYREEMNDIFHKNHIQLLTYKPVKIKTVTENHG